MVDQKIWVSSDWHLIRKNKESGLTYIHPDAEEIIDSQHQMVGDDDIFIFMGDMFDDNIVSCEGDIKNILGEKLYNKLINLKGSEKIFIKGNNDIWSNWFYLNDLRFNKIRYSYIIPEKKIIISHTSLDIFRNDWINIHGHIHRDGVPAYDIAYYHNPERCINILNRGQGAIVNLDDISRDEVNINNKICKGLEKPKARFLQNKAFEDFVKNLEG